MRRVEFVDRMDRVGLRALGWRAAAGLVAAAIVLGAGAPSASADRRIFGFTYPYMTLPQGGFELEHYLDAKIFDELDDPSTDDVETEHAIEWKHQVEAEYGITDHWDFGLYQVFSQGPFGSLGYDGTKLRSRYRFAEEGQLFVDPAVYLEVGFFDDEVKLEQIAILGRKFGPVELALNLKFEEVFQIKGGDTFEFEFYPSFGVGYHVNEYFAVGLEYMGKMKMEDGEYEYFVHYLGPSLSVHGNHFWWTVAFEPQLGGRDASPDYQARSIFAVVF